MNAEALAFDLNEAKRDRELFFAATGIRETGNHLHCPFHEDAHGSFSVWIDPQGVPRWKCHAGCGQGTVVDALALAQEVTPAEAIRRLVADASDRSRLGTRIAHRGPHHHPGARRNAFSEPVPPVPDIPRLERFVGRAVIGLTHDPRSQAKWLARRGIPLAVVEQYSLGFLERVAFPEWPTLIITNTWVIPVCDAAGNALAVKLHRESPPPKSPKCLWCPFGTTRDPATGRLRHGFSTLYPPPKWAVEWAERSAIREFDGGCPRPEADRLAGLESGWLYLCPGELKALAVVGAGRAATSVTAGESHRWTCGMVSRLRPFRVCVVFDDDEAGHRFRDGTLAALGGVAVALRAITFGKQ